MSDLSSEPIVPVKGPRFVQLREGPARSLQHCLKALRRGDRVVVLTGRERSERHALLGEIARLAGRDHGRIERIDGSSVGAGFVDLLAKRDIAGCSAGPGPLPWRPPVARTLLIVDEAEMLPLDTLASLANLRDMQTGARVQILLAGSTYLLPVLCRPANAAIWRGVRLAVTLEPAMPQPGLRELEVLQHEIARTEARLEAQRRLLSIFANDLGDPGCQNKEP